MRFISKRPLFAFAVLATGVCSGLAVAPDVNPGKFQQIPERNVFALKSPAAPVVTNAPPQTAKILLTGITTILGNKRALLKELPLSAPGKPIDATKEVSHILTEGQREGNVEVLQIDEKAGAVKVSVAGTVQTLTFEKDGVKLPSTPGPGTAGAPSNAAGPPGMGAVAGGITAPSPNPAGIIDSNHTSRPLPTRAPRWPMTGTSEASATPEVPSPTGRTGGVPTASAVAPAPPAPGADMQGLTPEEQRIVQQLQQAAQPNPTVPSSSASGSFQTPAQEGIAPAFAVPPPPPLPGNPKQILPQ